MGDRHREVVVHEVMRNGNLDMLLRAGIGAINRLADAIASPDDSLAKATRESGGGGDNSAILARLEQIDASINHFADVLGTITTDQGVLDALKDRLSTSTASLKDAVERHTNEGE
jgi:hypothetical protein